MELPRSKSSLGGVPGDSWRIGDPGNKNTNKSKMYTMYLTNLVAVALKATLEGHQTLSQMKYSRVGAIR